MQSTGNIFLVGPMGAGKSTVGRKLAQTLHWEFVDSDQEIEDRTGASIPLIFELEGEAGFRAREKAVIAELTARRNIVLATGGGAVLDPDNRRCLSGRGIVIYLSATVDEQLERVSQDDHRPLLHTADPRGRLAELLAAREPLYRQIADFIVPTDRRHVKQVVSHILRCLRD